MMFVLQSSLNHSPIKYECLIKKSNRLTPAYLKVFVSTCECESLDREYYGSNELKMREILREFQPGFSISSVLCHHEFHHTHSCKYISISTSLHIYLEGVIVSCFMELNQLEFHTRDLSCGRNKQKQWN